MERKLHFCQLTCERSAIKGSVHTWRSTSAVCAPSMRRRPAKIRRCSEGKRVLWVILQQGLLNVTNCAFQWHLQAQWCISFELAWRLDDELDVWHLFPRPQPTSVRPCRARAGRAENREALSKQAKPGKGRTKYRRGGGPAAPERRESQGWAAVSLAARSSP